MYNMYNAQISFVQLLKCIKIPPTLFCKMSKEFYIMKPHSVVIAELIYKSVLLVCNVSVLMYSRKCMKECKCYQV